MRDAQENAKVVAGAANVTVSGLRTIKTVVAESYGYAQQAMVADAVETVTGFPVEPGEIRVTTQVTASFLFTK